MSGKSVFGLRCFLGQGEDGFGREVLTKGSQYDLFKRGPATDLFQLGIKRIEPDQGFRLGVVQFVIQFGLFEHGVDRHHDRPGPLDAEIGDDELGAVFHVDGHPVARFDSQIHQSPGAPVDQTVQLLVGEVPTMETEGDVAGGQECPIPKVLGSRLLDGNRFWNPEGPDFMPATFHRQPPLKR